MGWLAKELKGKRSAEVPQNQFSDKISGNIVDVSSALPSEDMDMLIPELDEQGVVVSANDIPEFAENLDQAKFPALKEQYSAYFSKMTSKLYSSAIPTQEAYCIFPRKIHGKKAQLERNRQRS